MTGAHAITVTTTCARFSNAAASTENQNRPEAVNRLDTFLSTWPRGGADGKSKPRLTVYVNYR